MKELYERFNFPKSSFTIDVISEDCVVIRNALSVEDCNKFIEIGKREKKKKGGTAHNQPLPKDFRNSDIAWIFPANMSETSKILLKWVGFVNEMMGWGAVFSKHMPHQNAQYTEYSTDGLYSWHRDINHEEKHPYETRMISTTVLLNNSDEFEGGEFQIETDCSFKLNPGNPGSEELAKLVFSHGGNKGLNKDVPKKYKTVVMKNKGDMVIFKSYQRHRVKKVTGGIRNSLVAWFNDGVLLNKMKSKRTKPIITRRGL